MSAMVKICTYCGINQGEKWIPNPNAGEINRWWVCATCQIIIRFQQRMSLLIILGAKTHCPHFIQEAKRIQEEIDAISKAEGIPTCTVFLGKRTKGSGE